MTRLVCAVAVAALALTGCSGSFCEDLDDTNKNLVDKIKACPNLSSGITYTEPTEAEMQQCENDFKTCTDSDKDALNKFLDCVNDLPDCTTSTEQSFSASFLACAAPLASVSASCGEATSDGLVRKGMALVKGH